MAHAGSAEAPEVTFTQKPDGTTEVAAMIGSDVVSVARIVPMTIRVGAATLRMDGIGGVATDEKHRHRGYSRRVMEAAVQRMRSGDALLSTLYGIPDFYVKFGYATAGPEHVIVLPDLSHRPGLPFGWQVRAFQSDDTPALRRLYAQTTAQAVGALARESEGKTWSRLAQAANKLDECRVVENASGELVAYAWRCSDAWWMSHWRRNEPGAFQVGEVVAADLAAADAILGVCQTWAEEQGIEQVHIAAPLEGPVAMAAMLLTARLERRYTRNGEFMARTLNPQRLLIALQPELDARLREACSGFQTTLLIRADEGAAALRIDQHGITVVSSESNMKLGESLAVEMPQSELARLALGSFPPAAVLARLPNPPDERTTQLLATLFPPRCPHVYPVDRF